MQLAIADADQSNTTMGGAKYPGMNPGMTVFLPYSAREYLPTGVKVATLTDSVAQSLATGDTTLRTRAIVFDPTGQMVLRNGLARGTLSGVAGSITKIVGDWNFADWSAGALANGVSSPGVLVYDGNQYAAQAFTTDSSRISWLKKNSDILIVNAYTGNVIR